jgi:AraC-like DNA-binding protein
MKKAAVKFPPIHIEETDVFLSARQYYLLQEPLLIEAIRRRDESAAIELINGVLVHIYSQGAENTEQLKGLLLELIVMMSRAASEMGASSSKMLGMGFRHLVKLSEVEDDEDLAGWLRAAFFRIMEAVHDVEPADQSDPRLIRSLEILRKKCGGKLSRGQVAREAGVSSGHLADLLHKHLGRSFSELLTEARVAKACELLGTTNLPLADVADQSGFSDQSHLTRVLRETRGATPRQLRIQLTEKR